MKKLSAVLLSALLVMGACGAPEEATVEAKIPQGFVVVSKDNLGSDTNMYTIKHIETGCYYVYANGWNSEDLEQMYENSGSGVIAYCEEK